MPEGIPVSHIVMKEPDFRPLERVAHFLISTPIGSRIVGRRIEGLFDTHEYPGATDEFAKRYKRGDYGWVAMNHVLHPDLLGTMEDLRRMKKLAGADGFLVPVAASLVNGAQAEQNKWYKLLVTYMGANSIYPLPTVTANDQRKFNMPSNYEEVITRVENARKDNLILFTNPEGTVQGGRRDKNGKLFGMQKVKATAVAEILGEIIEENRDNISDFVVLPVGVWGTENFLDPDARKKNEDKYIPAAEVLRELKRLPFSRAVRRTFSNVRIGLPFSKAEYRHYLYLKGKLDEDSSDQLLGLFMQKYPNPFFDFLMRENIARMIPREYRGVYDFEEVETA